MNENPDRLNTEATATAAATLNKRDSAPLPSTEGKSDFVGRIDTLSDEVKGRISEAEEAALTLEKSERQLTDEERALASHENQREVQTQSLNSLTALPADPATESLMAMVIDEQQKTLARVNDRINTTQQEIIQSRQKVTEAKAALTSASTFRDISISGLVHVLNTLSDNIGQVNEADAIEILAGLRGLRTKSGDLLTTLHGSIDGLKAAMASKYPKLENFDLDKSR